MQWTDPAAWMRKANSIDQATILVHEGNESVVQVVFGGAGAQGPLGDLWVFDLTSRQWSEPATHGDPPAAREMHTGTMVDDTRMLIYGGRGPDGQVTHSFTQKEVWSVDPRSHQEP